MRNYLLRSVLAIVVAATAWGWAGTTNVAQADQVMRSVRSNPALRANLRRLRRLSFFGGANYVSPYVGPYWDGYYSPYASPPLYYNRIAPGVYYYY